jgi:hypothetical protein
MSSVSRPATLAKLAGMRAGQKVVLKCHRANGSGEVVVDDAKKKANWWKRGLVIAAAVIVVITWLLSWGL